MSSTLHLHPWNVHVYTRKYHFVIGYHLQDACGVNRCYGKFESWVLGISESSLYFKSFLNGRMQHTRCILSVVTPSVLLARK